MSNMIILIIFVKNFRWILKSSTVIGMLIKIFFLNFKIVYKCLRLVIGQIRYRHASNRIYAHCLQRWLSCTYNRSSACRCLRLHNLPSHITRISESHLLQRVTPKRSWTITIFFKSFHPLRATKCAGSASHNIII